MTQGGSHTGYDFHFRSAKLLVWLISSYESTYIEVTGSTTFTANVERHVAMTCDGSSSAAGIALFVDGVPETISVQQDTLSGSMITSTSFQVGIRDWSAHSFSGGIRDLYVFDYAVSA
eukprot:5683696-Prymnesium_polylepis.1